MTDTNTNPVLMALLDQYAQESGFRDLADMKASYTDRAYAAALGAMLQRAKSAQDTAQ